MRDHACFQDFHILQSFRISDDAGCELHGLVNMQNIIHYIQTCNYLKAEHLKNLEILADWKSSVRHFHVDYVFVLLLFKFYLCATLPDGSSGSRIGLPELHSPASTCRSKWAELADS